MTINDIIQFYSNRITQTKQSLTKTKRIIHLTGTLRLAVVILSGILIYLCWDSNSVIIGLIILLTIIPFLWLVRKHSRLFEKKLYLEKSIASDENELKGIDYNFSAYDGGNERIRSDHPFSLDLDVFGNKSLFQSINRTGTIYGKATLADWFETPLQDKKEILLRQKAIIELAENKEHIHQFIVTGLLNPGSHSDLEEIKRFGAYPSIFSRRKIWEVLTYVVPACWVVIALLLYFQLIPIQLLGFCIISFMILGECKDKKIKVLHNMIGRKVKIFSGYSQSIRLIEEQRPKSELLQQIKAQFNADNKNASSIIRQLSKLMGDLDQRYNVPARLILNTLFLWDIRKSIAIENWKERNTAYLDLWINELGKYDALCSMSVFLNTHPGYVFPSISEHYFEMKGCALGHPLLNRKICVKNDVEIPGNPYFMIVTGANMAGKSTYLRTVGVNYLLACMGLPVCADSFTIYPAALITSLRTSDSLTDHESYFFAELKRLKMIIDELNKGKELFIILDEILKGTNSIDKQKGSRALIQQLVSFNTCGIIATHDLLIGSLENEYPEQIKNMRFEADITNDELYFSYNMRTGIAQNMNACFLMKKMGITI